MSDLNPSKKITITLDVMGGDDAPQIPIEGAVWAARDFDITIQLVGQPDLIKAELAKHDLTNLSLPIIPASQIIEMHEHPSSAVKNKPDSSMVVAVEQVKGGQSDGFVTAGNSGGALAAALFGLGRIKGIKRPALGTIFPSRSGRVFMLDVGANTEVKPEFLAQFGVMGACYAEQVLNIPTPRIGLLSIGEEEDKGSWLTQEATPLLQQSDFNFIGNVEGKDIPTGVVDVVVTDGFTGNVFLKGAEGIARFIVESLKQEIKKRPLAIAGAFLAQGAFKAVEARFDYREVGGGILLGVNGVTVVAHGRSDAFAIRNAIRTALEAAQNGIVQSIQQS